jgi:hypothetical protein
MTDTTAEELEASIGVVADDIMNCLDVSLPIVLAAARAHLARLPAPAIDAEDERIVDDLMAKRAAGLRETPMRAPVGAPLEWYSDKCGATEPAQDDYELGDREQCVHCDDDICRAEVRATARAPAAGVPHWEDWADVLAGYDRWLEYDNDNTIKWSEHVVGPVAAALEKSFRLGVESQRAPAAGAPSEVVAEAREAVDRLYAAEGGYELRRAYMEAAHAALDTLERELKRQDEVIRLYQILDRGKR